MKPKLQNSKDALLQAFAEASEELLSALSLTSMSPLVNDFYVQLNNVMDNYHQYKPCTCDANADSVFTCQRHGHKQLRALRKAIADVLASEDNTGCSDDLTVVSAKAIETLRQLAEGVRK